MRSLEPLLDETRGPVVAIDMPIGLPERFNPGGRDCDRLARALLNAGGSGRGCTIFTPPTRLALNAAHYRQACAANAKGAAPGARAGLSKQSFNLFPKIRELDALMTPAHQARVHETHPELVFMALAGGPLTQPKKSAQGRARRIELLAGAGIADAADLIASARAFAHGAALPHGHAAVRVQPDDVLDALACALAARRISLGLAQRLPEPLKAQRDARGLDMAVWF